MTKLAILILTGLILPALWGGLMHLLLNRLWPRRWRQPAGSQESDASRATTDFWDYQI